MRDNSTKALVWKLKDQYCDVSVRPIRDHRKPVEVFIRMLLYELIEFNENQQKITVRSNMRLKWIDEYLQWEPSEWDDIYNITLHIKDIWKPDIALEQNVHKDGISITDTYVIIQHTGLVDWLFPATTTSACKINIMYFPYDIQQCNMTFYPWTLTRTQMRLFGLNDEDALQERFVRNGIWNLTNFLPVNESITFKCCPDSFDHVVYMLTFTRETSFFNTNIVIPALYLTVLMLIGFWLHPDSGEKITFTVTNLLALILFQQLVAEFMPPIGEPRSIIVTCFFILITLSVCSVMLTVIVLHVYHKDVVSRPPSWAFWLLRIFINRNAEKKMRDYYKYLEAKECERKDSTIRYICDTVPPPAVLDNASPPSSEVVGESSSLQEGSIDSKAFKVKCSMELSNSFMWKQLAHGIDRAFGTILSACMMGCAIYAVVSFSQAP
nr:neuronal acetylcholine receptor subunit alpha-9-like [Lytechinus pictus]